VKFFSFATPGNLGAWQPLTPRGIAAFASAPWRRLLVVQLAFAIIAALVVTWCLRTAWFPAMREAVRALPARGEIRSGKLMWSGRSPAVLAESHFLAFTVDPEHASGMRSPSHIQVEFGTSSVRMYSLLGYVERSYPAEWIISFNRPELEPWWGAWRAPILWIVFGGTVAGLLLVWWLLGLICALPVWLIGFFANRDLPRLGSWKLAGAALMPGTLLMTAALVLYGAGVLDLVQLLAAEIGHLLVGFVYAALSPFFLPRISLPEVAKGNPFARAEKAIVTEKAES
jgi:hypothetical protein